MTERHLHSDPPTAAEIAAAIARHRRGPRPAAEAVDLAGVATLVGLAGSVTTITAHALRAADVRPRRASTSPSCRVDRVARGLRRAAARMTRASGRRWAFMHPGRVDVIGAGALVWHQIVERVLASAGVGQVVTSEHDILDGIALSLA